MRSGKGKTKITAMALSLAMMCGMGATATSASAADATVDPDIKSCLDGKTTIQRCQWQDATCRRYEVDVLCWHLHWF